MRLLLDTHLALWAVDGDQRLSTATRKLLEDGTHRIFVSVVSLWEIAIKTALRSAQHDPIRVTTREAHGLFTQAGFSILPVVAEHAMLLADLPWIHRDPFERMLVCQAQKELLLFLTGDRTLGRYGDFVRLV